MIFLYNKIPIQNGFGQNFFNCQPIFIHFAAHFRTNSAPYSAMKIFCQKFNAIENICEIPLSESRKHELEWQSLETRREQSSLTFFYKIHSGTVSLDKDKYLTPAPNLRRTRASHESQYTRYLAYSDALKILFFPRTIPMWNSLPFSVVSSKTIELCDVSVGWEDRGICCDTCNVWYHIDCQGMSPTMYSIYNRSLGKSMAWECMRCGMPNFSTSLFDTTASLEVSNRFETLSSLSEPDSPVPDNIAPPPPKAASSPIVQQSKEAKPKTNKAVLNHPLRILIMNCQSVKNKKAELHTIIDSAKPDIILGNESWLSPDIKKTLKCFQTLLCHPERQSRRRPWWCFHCL